MQIFVAVFAWFQQNFPAIQSLVQNIALDIGSLYILALSLASVLAPFFQKAKVAKAKLLGVLSK